MIRVELMTGLNRKTLSRDTKIQQNKDGEMWGCKVIINSIVVSVTREIMQNILFLDIYFEC